MREQKTIHERRTFHNLSPLRIKQRSEIQEACTGRNRLEWTGLGTELRKGVPGLFSEVSLFPII